jgi:methionine sulfoxide reductase heme-binding subunit
MRPARLLAVTQVAWYLTRSSGIVATVLAVAALCWGFLFSARETGRRLHPTWWLDLHNWLGGLALTFTALHVVAALAYKDYHLRILDVLVPGTARHQTAALAWGIVAFEIFAIATFTSLRRVRPKLSRKLWRVLHLLSVPAAVLMFVHAYQTGSDESTKPFQIGFVLLAAVAVYPGALRLFSLKRRTSR